MSRTYSKAAGIFISIVLILGISFALASLCYACYYNIGRPWSQHYCDSPQCVRSAQNLIAAMNTSADPCEDFYNFACGNFAQYQPIKYRFSTDWYDIGTDLILKNISTYLELNGFDSDPIPVLQARLLYQQCLGIPDQEEENFESISSVLQDVGLPVLPPLDQSSSNFSLLYSMTQSKLIYNKNFFVSFAIIITTDPENSTRSMLFLSKPSSDSPLPAHHNLHNLKKRQKREKNGHSLADTEERKTYETSAYEALYPPQLNENAFNFNDKINSYASAVYECAFRVFEFAYSSTDRPNNESWRNVSNTTIRSNILKLMMMDKILFEKLAITLSSNDSVIPVRMSVKNLQKMTDDLWPKESAIPKIIWEDYFKQMFNDVSDIKLNFDDGKLDAEIMIQDLFYISEILKWIAGETTLQELEMYMWWTTVTTIAPYTSSKIRGCADNYRYALEGIEPKPRNIHCASIVKSIYEEAVASLFLKNVDKQNDVDQITEMVENIRSPFIESMKNVAWMDNETKNVTIEKLKRMKICVGPPTSSNDIDVWEKYGENARDGKVHGTNKAVLIVAKLTSHPILVSIDSQIDVDKNTFLDNILRLVQTHSLSKRESYRNKIIMSCITEELTTKTRCTFPNPVDVNAYYFPSYNQIAIPVGILQFPFYIEQGLQVLNYGAIGSTIGHELTHGFDNMRTEYNCKGRTGHSGWTNKTLTEYRKRIQCIIDHYENFHEDIPRPSKIGILTLDENIADIGGLRHAFYAYRNYVLEHGPEPLLSELKQYTSEQLFFLAYANSQCKAVHENRKSSIPIATDTHSRHHVRVWGTLTNSKEFAEAWKCEQGTRMNPSKNKCELW